MKINPIEFTTLTPDQYTAIIIMTVIFIYITQLIYKDLGAKTVLLFAPIVLSVIAVITLLAKGVVTC